MRADPRTVGPTLWGLYGMTELETHPRKDCGHDNDDAPTVDHLQELGKVERLLRDDSRAFDCRVQVAKSVSISWTSLKRDTCSRACLTAALCSEIARSSNWTLVSVEDTFETNLELSHSGEGTVSTLTAVHDPDTEADR